ncbi:MULTISPECIES: peptidoglycan-binding protein [unclassified Streptomyces]|uniref:peptidoglycan-binding domain-containing protein n=1 Tax=unclassified Streptomyces TaxID=2593676 RepID=UPI0011816DD6|nr:MULTISPECIES: peptidoglycan-binding domain-containing protein [unclassified Streptomyces]TRO60473.1 peptidoglycan-binding protein [Streptomyces sp. IB201691-2A2]
MSTPSDPQLPPNRSALEPTHVMRRRRSGALSELVRQVQERERDPDDGYEFVAVPVADTAALPRTAEDDTQELPPYIVDFGSDEGHDQGGTRGRRVARTTAHGRTSLFRRTAIAIAAVAAALAGFSAALLLTWDREATDDKAQAPPPAASSAPAPSQPAAAPDPDGAGTLREGDSGPEVSDLQERLLRIPNVYEGGTATGRYDATLTEAVARFQLWYGIRGDESGVYGNDTRTDLESRTGS